MDVRSLLIRTRLAARRIGSRAKVRLAKPPPPWAQLTVASFAFVAALTGAIFAGLNYFRSFKTAALVVDHFEDYQTKAPIPGVGEKNFHVLRMWAANYGQSSAKILNVAISPEFTTTLMTPEQETGRMDYVAKNKASIGSTPNVEITNGQKYFFPAHTGFPDELWSEFATKKQLMYVFAIITFTDEKSGDREVVTEICARLEPSLNSWNHCAGHNQTIR
jgi:hypothetical protein